MRRVIILVCSVMLTAPACLFAEPLTVVQTWQSPNEIKAFNVLETRFNESDLTITTLQPSDASLDGSEAIKGLANSLAETPTLLSLSNEELRQWYDLRQLHSLTQIAQEQNWAERIPPEILETVTHRGQIIAAPISVHTSNWVWANKQLVDATGIDYQASWTDLLAVLQALADDGVTPIAHDGSSEQDLLIFETLYLADFGAGKYTELFDQLNQTALRNAEDDFTNVLTKMAQLKPYIQRLDASSGWHDAIAMLTANTAGLVIQGDWAHGELARQGRIANQHYYCTAFPGEYDALSLRVDAIAALNARSQPITPAQRSALKVIMDKDAQYFFNNYKGGLPAISGTGLESISECLQFAVQRKQQALSAGTLVPSLSQGMAVRDVIRREIAAVIHAFMTSDQQPMDAADELQKRMKYAAYLIN